MPLYTYLCEKCEIGLEISKEMAKAGDPEQCPVCQSTLIRDYLSDNIRFIQEQKTLGSFADKRSKAMTEDQKKDIQDSLDPKKRKYEINK